jgi:hypothetical protein
MSKPEETTPTPTADDDPDVRFAKFMAEPMPPFVPRKRRKVVQHTALRVEVTQDVFEAAKANPNKVKVFATDKNGKEIGGKPRSGVTLRSVGVISEDEVGTAEYERIRAESIGRPQPVEGSLPALPYYGSAPDQRWTERRTWTGETRYVLDDGGRNPYVQHQYDIFDVLRRED